MKVAFHFEIDLGEEEIRVEVAVMRALLEIPPHRRHVRLFRGLVGRRSLPTDLERFAVDIVGGATVSTIGVAQFHDLVTRDRLFVFVIDGLTLRQAAATNDVLLSYAGYAGLIGLDEAVGKHWAFYQLPAAYRVIGDELRVQHTFDALEGDPAEWERRVDEWNRRHLFGSVVLENVGVQQTIFDEFDTPENARRRAEAASLLEDQFGGVANDVLLRLADLDPHLVEGVRATLTAFETSETGEQRAQVALGLRRLIARLADALIAPTDVMRGDRKMGKEQYRNRLWAYVEDNADGTRRSLVLSALEDIGARIDRITELVNAGLHDEVDPTELQRLVVGVVALFYDLLLLAPMPAAVPDRPYRASVRKMMREIFGSEE